MTKYFLFAHIMQSLHDGVTFFWDADIECSRDRVTLKKWPVDDRHQDKTWQSIFFTMIGFFFAEAREETKEIEIKPPWVRVK